MGSLTLHDRFIKSSQFYSVRCLKEMQMHQNFWINHRVPFETYIAPAIQSTESCIAKELALSTPVFIAEEEKELCEKGILSITTKCLQ